MKYLNAMMQTRRMGGFCKWCNDDTGMVALAERLGTRPPWLADVRYRRAFTQRVAAHLKRCPGGFLGKPAPKGFR